MPLGDNIIRLVIEFPDGTMFDRAWTMRELRETPEGELPEIIHAAGLPGWLTDARREWPHPQDPVTLYGRVVDGREAEARAALRMDAE